MLPSAGTVLLLPVQDAMLGVTIAQGHSAPRLLLCITGAQAQEELQLLVCLGGRPAVRSLPVALVAHNVVVHRLPDGRRRLLLRCCTGACG